MGGYLRQILFVSVLGFGLSTWAKVLYVDLNSTHATVPYADWQTAATNIQDAVDAASAGDTVWVTNGTYETGGRAWQGFLTNRAVVPRAITLQSVNGPQVTIIKGFQVPGSILGTNAVRCVFLTAGAVLSGFTVVSGATGSERVLSHMDPDYLGGGVYCGQATALVTNCVILGNAAGASGGGVCGAEVRNCAIVSNTAATGGGVAGAALYNCVIARNVAAYGGGVVGGQVNNCLVLSNSATQYGGGAGSARLNGCDIIGNTAPTGGGVADGSLRGCIIYYNQATKDPNWTITSGATMLDCCTTPMFDGYGNLTNEPGFAEVTNGDFHLQSNSPCINAGPNAYVFGTTDFEGNPRVRGMTVDIGAYEWQSPGSVISFAWLQKYGLPIDGSADFLDADQDDMNNWQEWVAGTDPTDASSYLKMLTLSKSASGVAVSWSCVGGKSYLVQCSTNLLQPTPFFTLQSNLVPARTGSMSIVDATATNDCPCFYRVGVQP